MLTVPGYETLETLHLGPKTAVYRALRLSDQTPVVLKALIDESPSIGDLGRYRYSYDITKDLKVKGICETYDLIETTQRPVLVMEDIGGISLREQMTQSKGQDLVQILRAMIQVAEALHQFHQHNLVHRDLKPSNLIVVPKTGVVQLVDFDLASRLTREAPEAWNPRVLQGTPAYISPEQTGRMNRMIDHRTDLYSAGVLLFELLAGRLPFEDTDTVSLIYSHIAVAPPDLCSLNKGLPPILNTITQKLLSKTPEARYQSAAGLKDDLARCLEMYLATGDCPPFDLATTDISPRLQPSQTLYGRSHDANALMDAFARVGQGGTEMLLVAGYSGIGKSSLVREVHKPIVGAKGRFASGKYDQLQNVPYAGLLQALQQLIEDILIEPEDELTYWRRVLTQELGHVAQVVIDVVPALELLIGPQPPAPQVPMVEAQNRFQRTLTKFVRIFATAEHPLTLFLDDLQWARSNTLQLCKQLLTDPDMHHLFLLGAYRDNEVDEVHPLSILCHELNELDAPLTTLQLTPLTREDINHFVADTLELEMTEVEPLSEVLFAKTQGNPFFTSRLLLNIHEEGLLHFDRKARKWQWDQEQLKALDVAENVLELMKRKMSRLPEETQEVLHLAACIGDQFDLATLAKLSERTTTAVADALWPALEQEFILPLTDAYRYISLIMSDKGQEQEANAVPLIAYRLLHDKLREAAYQMKPLAARQSVHLRLARLWSNTFQEEQRQEHLFDLVNHWNQGHELLESEEERRALAVRNVEAGRKAMEAAAYAVANDYFSMAIKMLRADAWSSDHKLSFDAYRFRAETAIMVGDFAEAEECEASIRAHTKGLADNVTYYKLLIKRLGMQSDIAGTRTAGLAALAELFDFPTPDTDEAWQAAMGAEFGAIAALLEGVALDSLVDRPTLNDPTSEISLQMDLLISLFPSASAEPKVLMVVVPRLVRLCLEHGHIPDSPVGYASYALLQAAGGEHILAEAFGKVALALSKRFGKLQAQPAVNMLYGCWVAHWTYPISEALEYTKRAVTDGLENGVFDWAGWASMNIPWLMMAQGAALDDVLKEARQGYKLARATLKYDDAAHSAAGCIHAILALHGDVDTTKQLAKELPSFEALLGKLSHYLMPILAMQVMQAQVACVMGDWQKALEHTEAAKPLIPVGAGLICASEFFLYRTLTLLVLRPDADEATQAAYLEEIQGNMVMIRKFATNGPDNHGCKKLLLDAELALAEGDVYLASERYDEAIDAAEAQGFSHIEGLALERAAALYRKRNKPRIARSYIADARYAYVRWGAQAKVSQLEDKHPSLSLQLNRLSSHKSTKGTTLSSGHGLIDIQTILKASQTLSEEIVLDVLLQKLMVTAIENAGAQRGLLLLRQHNQWHVEAEIESQAQSPRVMEHKPLDDNLLSASVVRFVERSRESLVLNNAQESARFGYDPYIVKYSIKSLLCTPIIHQAQLLGVLYLENNLATNAFTDERCAILDIISAQAAISIENAQLYASLEEKVEERTLELRDMISKLQSTQSQLVQSEKMASLGTLVAGVAHEINNPANFTHSGSQNLMRRMEDLRNFILELAGGDDNPEAADLFESKFAPIFSNLHAIVDGTQRIKGIVRDLRTFSRLDEAEQKEADLIAGINSTLSLVKANYHEHVDFAAIFEKPEVYLNCWPAQLNQVFMNMMVNACQAILARLETIPGGPRGQLIVRTTTHDDQLHINFEDNGCGMSKAVKDRVFEPFFTTRVVGQGTGLGLSISYGIIEKHGGRIEVSSLPGQGTTFSLILPLHSEVERLQG